ncbi:uncharacterized protein LOC127724158 [Mytilus californianus]|uniref:uncharacterized protein LOC127724158 n=1 Tax=Mytilus californianus TaxID=6549 RepID=UPI00224583B0|nr:uncharacterized protein LOC127724158 [Mytilus californianus]
MAVVGLYALAKELSTQCPIEIRTPNAAPDSCCQYNLIDCSIRYENSIYRNYYQQCNGKTGCRIQVSWVVTTCNQTVYLDRTNYMKMDYYCVSDQALDPCSSFNTRDNRVFLWNPGYPSTPLTGSSTCTCSVEASCNTTVRLTAIDLRFRSSTTCNQSITITDGNTSTMFDCSDNNDNLPTTLYDSMSHFIQIQIADNLGSADGYFFLLLEGTSFGAELTLSCASTAQATPTVPSASLLDCPSPDITTEIKTTQAATTTPYISSEAPTSSFQSTNIESMTTPTVVTTESTTTPPVTSTETYISSKAHIPSMQSANVESMTIPTVVATTNSTPSVIKDVYTTSDIPHTIGTNTDLTITMKSEVTLTKTNEVKATAKTITELNSTTNNEITIPSGNTTKRSTAGMSNSTEINNSQTTTAAVTYTSTEPVFVSLGWTSTLQNITVTRTFTPISSDSDNSQKTPSTVIEQTTFTNATVSVDTSSPNRIRPLIIGFSVAVIMICILVMLFVLYRYKRKGKCCKFSRRTNEDSCRVYQMTTI